jgi:hypothetical protein
VPSPRVPRVWRNCCRPGKANGSARDRGHRTPDSAGAC